VTIRTQNTEILNPVVGVVSIDVVESERQRFTAPGVEAAALASCLLESFGDEPLTKR
jgi:hypothetical protein